MMPVAEQQPAAVDLPFVVEDIDPRDPARRDLARKWTKRFVSMKTVTLGFLVGFCFSAGYAYAIQFPIGDALILYSCIAGPICLAALASSVSYKSQNYERRFLFRDGFFILQTPNLFERQPARDCCWYYGKSHFDTTFDSVLFRGPALIFIFPDGPQVACGLTPEKRDEWIHLFKQTGCTQVIGSLSWLGWLRAATVGLFFFLGIYVGWQAGKFIRDQWFPNLINGPLEMLPPSWLAALLALLFPIAILLKFSGKWQVTKLGKGYIRVSIINYATFVAIRFYWPFGIAGVIAAGLLAVIL